MILPNFTYLEPHSLREACAMLGSHQNKGARVLAGGTDILVDLKQRIFVSDQRMKDVSFLVSLCKISDLHEVIVSDSTITIGALVTMTELSEHPVIRQHLNALVEGASEVGSPLVRNRGTLAGNIANARPAADTAGPTIALNGIIITERQQGGRRIEAAQFCTAPGKNVLQQDEIIRAIEFPISVSPKGSAYAKLAVRKALDISIVGVAAAVELKNDGSCRHAHVCLTSVGPVPIVSSKAATALIGKSLSDATLFAAAKAASEDARPIDDYRGSAWYRKEMAGVLTKRIVKRSWEQALKEVQG